MSTALVLSLKAGDRSAFDGLFARAHSWVLAVARRRLAGRRAVPCDPEDVAASVLASFFREVTAGGRIRDGLSDTDSLLRALALLTGQKVGRRARHFGRQKRDARRSAPLRADVAAGGAGGDAVALADLLGRLDAGHRAVAELLIEGHTRDEIADRLGCGPRTVYRRQRVIAEVLRAAGLAE